MKTAFISADDGNRPTLLTASESITIYEGNAQTKSTL
jgi:hypothetical protein